VRGFAASPDLVSLTPVFGAASPRRGEMVAAARPSPSTGVRV
jgi:hypothetical protein